MIKILALGYGRGNVRPYDIYHAISMISHRRHAITATLYLGNRQKVLGKERANRGRSLKETARKRLCLYLTTFRGLPDANDLFHHNFLRRANDLLNRKGVLRGKANIPGRLAV